MYQLQPLIRTLCTHHPTSHCPSNPTFPLFPIHSLHLTARPPKPPFPGPHLAEQCVHEGGHEHGPGGQGRGQVGHGGQHVRQEGLGPGRGAAQGAGRGRRQGGLVTIKLRGSLQALCGIDPMVKHFRLWLRLWFDLFAWRWIAACEVLCIGEATTTSPPALPLSSPAHQRRAAFRDVPAPSRPSPTRPLHLVDRFRFSYSAALR